MSSNGNNNTFTIPIIGNGVIAKDNHDAEYCTEFQLKNAEITNIHQEHGGGHILGYECLTGYEYTNGTNKGRLLCWERNGQLDFKDALPKCTFNEEISVGIGIGIPLLLTAVIMLYLYLRLRNKNNFLRDAKLQENGSLNLRRMSTACQPTHSHGDVTRYTSEPLYSSNRRPVQPTDQYSVSRSEVSEVESQRYEEPDRPNQFIYSSSNSLPLSRKRISIYEPQMIALSPNPLHNHPPTYGPRTSGPYHDRRAPIGTSLPNLKSPYYSAVSPESEPL